MRSRRLKRDAKEFQAVRARGVFDLFKTVSICGSSRDLHCDYIPGCGIGFELCTSVLGVVVCCTQYEVQCKLLSGRASALQAESLPACGGVADSIPVSRSRYGIRSLTGKRPSACSLTSPRPDTGLDRFLAKATFCLSARGSPSQKLELLLLARSGRDIQRWYATYVDGASHGIPESPIIEDKRAVHFGGRA